MNKNQGNKGKTIISFFIGAILATCITLFGFDYLSKEIPVLITGFIIFLVLTSIFFLIITLKIEWVFLKIFGRKHQKSEDLQNNLNSLLDGLKNQDLNAINDSGKKSLSSLASIYSWITYRKWVVSVFYTLLIGFAGLLGSVLVLNQNKLFETQNSIIQKQTILFEQQGIRLDQQTYLQEAERRSSLVFLLGNITDAIDRELNEDVGKDNVRNLSSQLVGRIVALSRSLRPYNYLEGNELIKVPLSPERGQLLIVLLESNLDEGTMQNIFSKADFSQADLKKANLKGVNLSNIDLRLSNLNGAKLMNSILDNTNFIGASIINAEFAGASLKGTFFSEAILDNSDFKGAEFKGPYFRNASLKNVDLSGSELTADFEEADLFKAKIGIAVDISFENTKLDSVKVYTKDFLKSSAGIRNIIPIQNNYIVDETPHLDDNKLDSFYYIVKFKK